jgi:outer membrane protein assembly factor BamA
MPILTSGKNVRIKLMQPGKPFSISLIKDERDRLRSMLEKKGYKNTAIIPLVF